MTINTQDRRYPEFTAGDRLRKARTLLGPDMDVSRFAELIGVNRNTVTNYELERTAPERMKSYVLNLWAMATGVDADWLRTGVRPEFSPTPGGGEQLVLGKRSVKGRWRPEQDSNLQPTGSRHGVLRQIRSRAA